MRRFRLALVPIGIALAVVAEWNSFRPGKLDEAVADGVVGVVVIACGVVAWERKGDSRTGPLLVLAGFTWLAGSLVPAARFWHRGPLVHVENSYPTGRLHRRLATATVVVAYVTSAVKPIAGNTVVTMVLAALVAAAAIDVFVSTSGRARRPAIPALATTLAFVGVLVAASLQRLAGLNVVRTVLFTYDGVVGLVAIALTADLVFGRWRDATVADLVVALGQRGGTGTLRDQLAKALGDPSLIVGYWIAEGGGFVDDSGRPVELPKEGAGRAVTELGVGGERVAVLVHDAATMDDRRLVASVAAAARLAVANARLQAQVRVRLAELTASRRRIVEAGDAQRRRIERELAEGVQRRIAEAMRLLDEASRETTGSDAASLDALCDELRAAQAELGDFAQGIRPSSLGEGGLTAALPVLAARAPSALHVELTIGVGRLRPAVEAAVYFVCSEALANVAKHASATRVSLVVAGRVDEVMATITDDGIGGADPTFGSGLRGLADRVEALGGRLDVGERSAGGTVLTVTIPIDQSIDSGVSWLAGEGLDDERGRSDAQ